MRDGLTLNKEASTEQFNAMCMQAKAAMNQYATMQQSLIETKRAADAAVMSAETAKQALYISESADILIKEVKHSTGHYLREDSDITITLVNSGKTKAVDLTIAAHAAILHRNHAP